jgi:hypothetical protein
MPLFDYDGQRFRVEAEGLYVGNQGLTGYLPACSMRLVESPRLDEEPPTHDIAVVIPGCPVLKDQDQALKVALDYVRLNWDAVKNRRVPRGGDIVIHIPTARVGLVAHGDTGPGVYVYVLFPTGEEGIASSDLRFLPELPA